MGGYMNSLREDVAELNYEGIDGFTRYTFTHDGQVTFLADAFTNTFSAEMQGFRCRSLCASTAPVKGNMKCKRVSPSRLQNALA